MDGISIDMGVVIRLIHGKKVVIVTPPIIVGDSYPIG